MPFQSVIGQKEIKEQLVQLLQQNRLSHALLFLGKEGAGTLPLAMAFAQYIVCEKTGGKERKPEPAGPSSSANRNPLTRNPYHLPMPAAPAPPASKPKNWCTLISIFRTRSSPKIGRETHQH